MPTKGRQYAAAFQRPPFPHLWCLSSQGSESVKGGVLCRRSEPLTDSLPCVQSRLQGKGAGGLRGLAPWRSMRQRLMRASSAQSLPLMVNTSWYLSSAPLSPCFHSHSDCGLPPRCPLVFSIQGVLPSPHRSEGDAVAWSPTRSAATSQSPQLGAFAYLQDPPMQTRMPLRCFAFGLGCFYRLAVVQRIVHFPRHPQAMQQYGQFTRYRYDRFLLALLIPFFPAILQLHYSPCL